MYVSFNFVIPVFHFYQYSAHLLKCSVSTIKPSALSISQSELTDVHENQCMQILNSSSLAPLPTTPLFLTYNIKMDTSSQSKMKNTCPCIVFHVLKVLLYENLQVRHSRKIICFMLFLLAFTSADIVFHTFLELQSTLSEKKIFVMNSPFLKDSLKRDKSFLLMLPYCVV